MNPRSCPLRNKNYSRLDFFLRSYFAFGFLCMLCPVIPSRFCIATLRCRKAGLRLAAFRRCGFGLSGSVAFLWLFRWNITDRRLRIIRRVSVVVLSLWSTNAPLACDVSKHISYNIIIFVFSCFNESFHSSESRSPPCSFSVYSFFPFFIFNV